MSRMFSGIRDRLGSGRSDRAERRRQRRVRTALIHGEVNRADPHGGAVSIEPVRGRGPERSQGRQ
jgi:hypothetical protein